MPTITAHDQRRILVRQEMERLERKHPDCAPFGGWYSTAVENVAKTEKMNPYTLHQQIKD